MFRRDEPCAGLPQNNKEREIPNESSPTSRRGGIIRKRAYMVGLPPLLLFFSSSSYCPNLDSTLFIMADLAKLLVSSLKALKRELTNGNSELCF